MKPPPGNRGSTGTDLLSPGLLRLLRLASPALPIGGFSYSEGLEAAIDGGRVGDEATVGDWLVAQLELTQARSELAVVAAAVRAVRTGDTERLRGLDRWVRLTRESAELRLQSEQMGRSLADWLRGLEPQAAATLTGWHPTYPVSYAIAAAAGEAALADICAAFTFAWAENLVQAALKALPLGQTAGQRVLARLCARIPAAVAQALALEEVQRQAFAPMLAIVSAQHETQYSRLFRS